MPSRGFGVEGFVVYSLRHSSHRLAPDSLPAFPIRLVFGEEDRPSSEGMLLENPPSLIQVPLNNVLFKIVNVIANVEGLIIGTRELDEFPLLPLVQKP